MSSPLVWLVTGCSSGFGEQFIRSILARGDKAIAAGRDVSRLNTLKEASAAVLQLDITAEQSTLVAKIREAIGCNRLFRLSYFQQSSLPNMIHRQANHCTSDSHGEFLSQFNASTFGAMNVTRAILPHFRQKRAGNIVS
jgi:NADP-dependent 3-hydroxy acid dehydrogenase YdfG